jgi:hypothetical protein
MTPEVTKERAENLLYQLAIEQQGKIAPSSPQNFDTSVLDATAIGGVYQLVMPSSRLIRVLSRIKQDAFRAVKKKPVLADTYYGAHQRALGGANEALADQEMINTRILDRTLAQDESQDPELMFVPGPPTLRFWEYLHGATKRVDGRFGLYHVRDCKKQQFRYSPDAMETNDKGEVLNLIEFSIDESSAYIEGKLRTFEDLKSRFREVLNKAAIRFVFLAKPQSDYNESCVSMAVQKARDEAYRTRYDHAALKDYVDKFLMPPKPHVLVYTGRRNH